MSARWTSDNKPEFGILTVQPIYESNTLKHTVFGQGSVFLHDNRTTFNLGTGYRRLAMDETLLSGINVFYDHEFPYDHQRMSIGGEIRTTVGELNINYYKAISQWVVGKNDVDERALGGYDLELGIPFPYIPQLIGYAKSFKWNSFNGKSDITGNTYSLKGAIRGINIEGGIRNYDSLDNERFLNVSVNVVKFLENRSQKPLIRDKPYELASMKDHRFDKVRRENIILKQTRGAFTVVTR